MSEVNAARFARSNVHSLRVLFLSVPLVFPFPYQAFYLLFLLLSVLLVRGVSSVSKHKHTPTKISASRGSLFGLSKPPHGCIRVSEMGEGKKAEKEAEK